MDVRGETGNMHTACLPIPDHILGLNLLSVGAVQSSDLTASGAGNRGWGDRLSIIFCSILGLGVCFHVKSMHWFDLSEIFQDPFCWAMLAMFSLIGASDTLVSHQLGRYPRLNIAFVALFGFCRFMLVLPFVEQLRFRVEDWHTVVGATLFLAGLVFLIPLTRIILFPAPGKPKQLVTTGFYSLVRNPIYLGEIMWSLGWAILWGSVIGIALVPFWWGGLLFLVFLEEEDLERKLGERYLAYKRQVAGRIIPGLPI